ANHGLVGGSLGVFDLSTLPAATEVALSPFPAGAGSVGVVAGPVTVGGVTAPMAFVTNTWFALGGCGMPTGSVTGYDLSLLSTAGLATPIDTIDVSGAIPYAVALAGGAAKAFVSVNCARKLDVVEVGRAAGVPVEAPVGARFTMTRGPSGDLDKGADASLYDPDRDLVYTVNITDGTVTVSSPIDGSRLTTVTLARPNGKNPGPIDANLGETQGGRSILVTSNGGDDSVSVLDRDLILQCVLGAAPSCPEAEVAHVPTAVPGGAPEGIDFDPATNRIFTVNKTILNPSLSVIQLCEPGTAVECTGGAEIGGEDVHRIPIAGIDAAAPVPALIAFDVVVEKD
ncbi:MAG: hypothetical protein ACREQY_01580, partial [Candidatus Binatia bacterium]